MTWFALTIDAARDGVDSGRGGQLATHRVRIPSATLREDAATPSRTFGSASDQVLDVHARGVVIDDVAHDVTVAEAEWIDRIGLDHPRVGGARSRCAPVRSRVRRGGLGRARFNGLLGDLMSGSCSYCRGLSPYVRSARLFRGVASSSIRPWVSSSDSAGSSSTSSCRWSAGLCCAPRVRFATFTARSATRAAGVTGTCIGSRTRSAGPIARCRPTECGAHRPRPKEVRAGPLVLHGRRVAQHRDEQCSARALVFGRSTIRRAVASARMFLASPTLCSAPGAGSYEESQHRLDPERSSSRTR